MDSFVWPQEFSCTLIENNLILPNTYQINLYIEPTIPVTNDIDIGFKKLKHFFDYKLKNSIFIEQDHSLLKHFNKLDNNLVSFPTEPYDYYVAAVLLAKFKTITEHYFNIYQITLDSTFGENIKYSVDDPKESGIKMTGNYWWNQDNDGTGFKLSNSWESLQIKSRFRPTLIKGGLSENQ